MSGPRGIVLSPVGSDPALSGNSVRVRQMCDLLGDLGCDVHFCLMPINAIASRLDEPALRQAWGERLTILGAGLGYPGRCLQRLLGGLKRRMRAGSVASYLPALMDFMFADGYISPKQRSDFHRLVAEVRPDFIIVNYAICSGMTLGLRQQPRLLLETHDRFAGRNQRIRDEGGMGFWVSLTQAQETRLMRRFDYVIAIQRHEAGRFQEALGPDADKVVTLDIISPSKRSDYRVQRPMTVGFICSNNRHNYEGLSAFLNQHWKHVRQQVQDATLVVAGPRFDSLEHWQAAGVEFIGRVDELGSFYDACALMINPCLTGSGLKIKSVEALEYAKPLITTPEGAIGLEDSQGEALEMYPLTDPNMSAACVRLLQDKRSAAEMSAAAISIIDSRYGENRKTLAELLGVVCSARRPAPHEPNTDLAS